MTEPAVVGFDYDQLSGDDWKFVQDARDEILSLKRHATENLIEMGRWLSEAKERLPWGQWGTWLATECRLSETTARRCMDGFQLSKSATVAELGNLLALPPTIVADMAAPTVSSSARTELLKRSEGGEKITRQKVQETAARYKSRSPSAD